MNSRRPMMDYQQKLPLGVKPNNGLPYEVILIDDSKMMRKLLSQILRSQNFEIIQEFESGDDVIAKYAHIDKHPEFAFVDIEMPGINGIETVKTLKGIDPQLKFIMCTSVTDKQVVRELLAMGISGYIVKPFDRDSVNERLAKILRRDDYIPKYL